MSRSLLFLLVGDARYTYRAYNLFRLESHAVLSYIPSSTVINTPYQLESHRLRGRQVTYNVSGSEHAQARTLPGRDATFP